MTSHASLMAKFLFHWDLIECKKNLIPVLLFRLWTLFACLHHGPWSKQSILFLTGLLADKNLPNFIPYGLKKELPALFIKWMQQHAAYMNDNWNIQIHNVMVPNYDQDYNTCASLAMLLQDQVGIYCVYPASYNNCLNVPVTSANYSKVCHWLDTQLQHYPFYPLCHSKFPLWQYTWQILQHFLSLLQQWTLSCNNDLLDVSKIQTAESNPWRCNTHV